MRRLNALRKLTKAIRLIFLICTAGSICACASVNRVSDRSNVKVTLVEMPNNGDSYLAFEGKIDDTNVDAALAILASEGYASKKIMIASGGGNYPSALRLAEKIEEIGGFTIQVKGVCLAVCANLLLPAADSVIIERGSLVALNADPIAWLAHSRADRTSSSVASHELRELASNLHSFYVRRNINLRMLECAWIATDPTSITIQDEMIDDTRHISFKVESRSSGWRLAESELSSFGLRNISFVAPRSSTTQMMARLPHLTFGDMSMDKCYNTPSHEFLSFIQSLSN